MAQTDIAPDWEIVDVFVLRQERLKHCQSTLHLTLLSLFIGAEGIAQPTITIEEVTPVIGSSVTTVNGPYVDPGPSGADQTWDFSDLSAQSANDRLFLAPDGLPEAESFPDATHAVYFESTSQQYTYFSYSNNTVDEVGFYSMGQNATIYTTYSDPLSRLILPLEYEDNFSDTYTNQTLNELDWGSEVLVNVYNEVGSFNALVDGYGTLITPIGTYEDVLRVHIETELDWTVSNDGMETGSGSRTKSEYHFYKAGIAIPLVSLGIATTSVDGEEVNTTSYGTYFASSTVGIDEAQSPLSAVEIFPVPAKDHFNLAVQSAKVGSAQIALFSIDGKLVREWPSLQLTAGKNEQRFDLPELPEGLYLVRVTTGNSCETRRLVLSN